MKFQKFEQTAKAAVFTSAIALASILPAFAGFSQGDAVTLGGQCAFRIEGSADGFSPEKRACMTQDRLDNALVQTSDRSPAAVSVEKRNGAYIVAIGGREIATADECSAKKASLSPADLANQWADSIKSFLSDKGKADTYIASLKSPNRLGADLAIVEKRLYAPAGTVLPVNFVSSFNSESATAGQVVEAKVTQDVPLGNYMIPSGSLVVGQIVETQPNVLAVTFNTLRTPSGTELPINASVTESYLVRSNGPHPVATIGIPANEALNCRVPASIGIGTVGAPGSTTLALHRGQSRAIGIGQPFNVTLDDVTPVAVIQRSTAM